MLNSCDLWLALLFMGCVWMIALSKSSVECLCFHWDFWKVRNNLFYSIQTMTAISSFTASNFVSVAMREPPVQSDKILDHQKFTHCGSALIDRVFSTRKYYSPLPSGARSIEELRRAEIVAQTRISWDPKELIALISEHLDSMGKYVIIPILAGFHLN